jgi:hypothetical protein
MSNVPIQLLLNGEERAEFVDSGITLLKFLGVRVDSLPLTPEKILRALQAKEGTQAAEA